MIRIAAWWLLISLAVALPMRGPAMAQALHGESERGVNAMPLAVRTPLSGYNRLVVQVTVCAPGTNRCATIDNIMVDTGSTGLRLQAAALPASLHLPSLTGPSGGPMGECLRFVSSAAWGPLRVADVHFAGLTAERLPVQVIEQGAAPLRPASCENSGVQPTSNGTLGIGTALDDCHSPCMQTADAPHPHFFECGATACVPLVGSVPAAFRLPNPVTRLPTHNNGIVIELPLPAPGAREAHGTLIFGVGTAANNQLGKARLLTLDANGRFTTQYKGQVIADSYIDSGTESYIFADPNLPRCPRVSWAYCVEPEIRLEATVSGTNGEPIETHFRVGNYQAIRDAHLGAMVGAAVAPNGARSQFVWGAPFFLGRRVAVLIQGLSPPNAPNIKGPLYAY